MGSHYKELSEDEIGFLEKAASRSVVVEHKRNYKSVVGAMGIVDREGNEVVVHWVQSSLARDIQPDPPQVKSAWMKELEQAMFRKWQEPIESPEEVVLSQ